MNLLGFDSSGGVCSVAVTADKKLKALISADNGLTHSETLMPMIEEAIRLSGLQKKDLDYIAVSEGPGSFTGLRIGAATAKGLCLALGIPLIAVPTLPAMAMLLEGTKGLLCPILDARRQQVYAGLYRFVAKDGVRRMETVMEAAPVFVAELIDTLHAKEETVTFLGDGVPVYEGILNEALQVPHFFAPSHLNRQNAAALNELALRMLADNTAKVMEGDAFTPVYLRPAQAERKSVLIRKMREEDLEKAHRLETASFSRPWTPDMLRTAMADADSVALVAATGDKIVGTAFVKNIAGEGSVTNVNVDIDFRRQGVGEAMLLELLKEGRAAGVNAFTLEVRETNTAAKKLYEKCGFVFEGVRPGFYEDPKEDATIYWLREHD